MSDQNEDLGNLSPGEREFAAALGSLSPSVPRINRDELMFAAGQAAARRARHPWQAATTLLALAFGISLWLGPSGTRMQRTIVETPPVAPTSFEMPLVATSSNITLAGTQDYLKLRDSVLASGLRSVPETSSGGTAFSELSLSQMRDFIQAGGRL